MLDRSIPFVNVIMKGGAKQYLPCRLPDGYEIRAYRPGDEEGWARIEHEIGDFDTYEEALSYFRENYLADREALEKRMLIAVDEAGRMAGSCIAWRDARGADTVASLHWLAVSDEYQGRGIGRALCEGTLSRFSELGETPVYIHTQPWSWIAVCLYASLGFRMQRTDTFSHYENQYERAMEVLGAVLPGSVMERLRDEAEA